jgi:hypothetical protein
MTKTEEIVKKIRESGIRPTRLAKEAGIEPKIAHNFMNGFDCVTKTLAKLEAAYYVIKSRQSQSAD